MQVGFPAQRVPVRSAEAPERRSFLRRTFERGTSMMPSPVTAGAMAIIGSAGFSGARAGAVLGDAAAGFIGETIGGTVGTAAGTAVGMIAGSILERRCRPVNQTPIDSGVQYSSRRMRLVNDQDLDRVLQDTSPVVVPEYVGERDAGKVEYSPSLSQEDKDSFEQTSAVKFANLVAGDAAPEQNPLPETEAEFAYMEPKAEVIPETPQEEYQRYGGTE